MWGRRQETGDRRQETGDRRQETGDRRQEAVRSWIVLALLLWSCPSFGERATGTISGFVYDGTTGEGLIAANVFLEGRYIGASSNVSGYYSIPRVPPGEYRLICQYIGYRTFAEVVRIEPDTPLKVDIVLEPTTIEAQEIRVVADSVRTIVKLYRKPISKIYFRPRQIESVPKVVEADLLRSLQTMPGILPISDFSSELYVRGGTPDQNLYLIDGADVYNPEHFFGLFSTFNTDAIKNVELSKGGFGAEYGGRLSSVLNVTNLDGNRREFEGKLNVSLLSARTTVQMPIGTLGALSGSLRRTYFDQTVAKALDDIPNYYFYDGHLKAYLDLTSSNKVTVSTYVGRDNLNYELEGGSEELDYAWGNTTGSLRWTHVFSPILFGNFWITASSFDSDMSFENFSEDNDIKDVTVKGDLEYYYAQNLNAEWGVEYKDITGEFGQEFPGGTVDVRRTPRHFATYLQAGWHPSPLVEFRVGLRYNDLRCMKRYWSLSPRFSAKYRLTETMNLKSAAGTYNQYLFRIPRTFIADIWTSSDAYYEGARSHHYILGFQKELPNDVEFEVETYYKDYDNLYSFSYFFYTDLKPGRYTAQGEPVYDDTRGLFDRGEGYSYGLEFLLRRDVEPVSGWISYSLGRTENEIEGINQGKSFVPRHDRTSTLNIVGTIDLRNTARLLKGEGLRTDRTTWKVGIGLVYATGQPITTTSSVYVTQPLPDQDFYDGYNLYPTERNSFRLPGYLRFDLSLTMEKRYRSWTLSPYLQIYNLGNRKNVWFIEYEDRLEEDRIVQEIDTFSMIPILPTIGVTMTF